eukprot:scaffold74766_cov48-Phaeocystis_antarctica.AAC.2
MWVATWQASLTDRSRRSRPYQPCLGVGVGLGLGVQPAVPALLRAWARVWARVKVRPYQPCLGGGPGLGEQPAVSALQHGLGVGLG